MIRLVATDMDNTFLDHDKQFARAWFGQLLTQLTRRDIPFVVASGNQRAKLAEYFTDFPVDNFIAENGAYVVYHGQTVSLTSFADSFMQRVVQYLLTVPGLTLTLCTPEMAYIPATSDPHMIQLMHFYYPKLTVVDSLLPYIHQVVKISIGCPHDQTTRLQHDWEQRFDHRLVATSSGLGNIDVIQPHQDKAAGLKTLGAKLHIPLSDMCAFGDGANDLTMLREVGTGVAMANATPAVKKVANAHTASCEENGVLRYLAPLLTDSPRKG